jgi:hypothetical protein
MNLRLRLCWLLLLSNGLFAQLKSPDEYLGYTLGSKFTPHYKIVQYFNQAAASVPQMMKLEQYGSTHEGRELLLAVISAPENMSRIEEIRKNNLRLTGILKDKPAVTDQPAIVWLSYNVHGNEASSSEVSMKTLYELLSPTNPQTKNWLKNTVIIIDPCLNPDGRDRYVNWFNQVVGKNADAKLVTREHSEPWPGGRINHYYFDLNRDWAWQTQVETQGRIKKYNAWMPQIHCDFHEQGINNPYYFAPAAEPFHEVITQWQRDFQYTIGKNHARYFDANGWLYFTKEVFDLFYPSYGDTYPTYNGAIGMTYEQAGHSQGGLAVLTNDGDTLSLKDRIAHHFTTSMSTIEMAAEHANKLTGEFKKYFDEGNTTGTGVYKTYVITVANAGKRAALQQFFDNNGILYGSISASSIKGYNYFTAKEEIFNAKNSLAVSALQPKSALVKVLFEPQTKLSDSLTYDITAWSLPYVYGAQCYAVKEKLALEKYSSPGKNAALPAMAYGYLVNYNSFADVTFLTALLQADIKVRFAEKDFKLNGKTFEKGTLIILKKGNEDKTAEFINLAQTFNATVTMVNSGFVDAGFDFGSEKVRLVKKPVVALLTGKDVNPNAAGEVWHLFEQQMNYPVSLINAEEMNGSVLKGIDVLIVPDGQYRFLNEKEQAAEIKMWVQQGGKMVVLDNAAAQLARADWGIKLKKSDEDVKEDKKEDKHKYADLKRYENRERDGIVNYIPGAIYKVELDNSHPLSFGYDDHYYALKLNTNLFEFMKDGWNVGVIKKDNQASGFVGNVARGKIQDGTAMGVLPMGNGSVIFFADDPVFRNFWENGKMLLANAVFLVGQ